MAAPRGPTPAVISAYPPGCRGQGAPPRADGGPVGSHDPPSTPGVAPTARGLASSTTLARRRSIQRLAAGGGAAACHACYALSWASSWDRRISASSLPRAAPL